MLFDCLLLVHDVEIHDIDKLLFWSIVFEMYNNF
jgi:hypothetical protein